MRRVQDPVAQKIVRLQNRISALAILVVCVQSISFWRLGLFQVIWINAGTMLGYLACLALTAIGRATWARFLFIAVAAVGIGHHHFYFGFATGFWLLLLNLSQAAFVLFPSNRLSTLLISSVLLSASIVAAILFSLSMPPVFQGLTTELGRQLLVGNIIRSPVLLVLVAYYLVHENRQVEAELRFSARQAEAASEAKALFLSNISHELRTPMNAILGFSDILIEAADTIDSIKLREKFQAQLKQIRLSAANLTSIINDLLDFARIDKDRIQFEQKPFSIREIAYNVMQTAEFYGLKQRQVTTEIVIDPSLPETVLGDAVRLSQILLNLAANAIKFTHEGFVRLNIKVVQSSTSSYAIRFEIEDTGIGIPRDRLPGLFESFSAITQQQSARQSGTGLGLAISKRLVELQGGSISVMSQEGVGSLFSVDLTFSKAVSESEQQKKVKRDLQKKKILIAEDNEANQMLIRALLESWNAELTIVADGKKAVEKLRSQSYDLVLMDLQMPVMDGIQAAEMIRAMPDRVKAATPIVALSADVLSDTRKRVMAVGMNDMVTKPINQAELFSALRNALRLN